MPSKPPSDDLFARAAELRAAGATWKAVARDVHRSVRTVHYWHRRYAERWAAAILRAEQQVIARAHRQSLLTLGKLLASQDERVRLKAARSLIGRRLDLDKVGVKNSTARPRSSREAAPPSD